MGTLFLTLVSCQPVVKGGQLTEEPTIEFIRGTARPNAIDRDSFYPERREGIYFEWIGGARTSSFREGLRIRYNRDGDIIDGEYALGSVGVLNYGFAGFGTLVGTVKNGIIEAVLIKDDSGCKYSVFGSVTADQILAYAEPVNCPDAETEEWDLGRS